MGHALAVLLYVCLVAQIVIEREKMDEEEKVQIGVKMVWELQKETEVEIVAEWITQMATVQVRIS